MYKILTGLMLSCGLAASQLAHAQVPATIVDQLFSFTSNPVGGSTELATYSSLSPPNEFGFVSIGPIIGDVTTALGDFNGDGRLDVAYGVATNVNQNSPPQSGVGILDAESIAPGKTPQLLGGFLAFDNFLGGVFVAAGDVTGDGTDEVIVGAGQGTTPSVKIFGASSADPVMEFFAFDPGFSGGVRVASGDVNGDGIEDIITGAGFGDTPQVRVFDGANPNNVLHDFFAFDSGFSGGVYVGSGDVNNDGIDDVVTGSGVGGPPQVNVFDGSNGALLDSFFPYTASFEGGVRVAAGDVNNDGAAEVITAPGPGTSPVVQIYTLGSQPPAQSLSANAPLGVAAGGSLEFQFLTSFMPYPESYQSGVHLAAVNLAPEPGTPVLLASSLLGALWVRRRK